MDATTLSRLAEFEKNKKFYDALQFCRTKVTRSFRLKNANEAAIPLMKHALNFFLNENQLQCAVDITTQYAECLSKNNVDFSDDAFELLADILAKLANLAEIEDDEQKEQLLTAARCKIVDLAIQWTKQKATKPEEKKYGSARFHKYLAKAFDAVDQGALAKNHYLLSDDATGFADMLRQAAEDEKEEDGDPHDEILVEAVLQALCLDRFPFARALFTAYVAPKKFEFERPLFNFQHILFDVIETENSAQFTALLDTYRGELSTFTGYLTRIGKLYLGIADVNCMAGGLSDLFANLLGGGPKGEERAVSHVSARTPVRKQPPTAAAASRPMPFANFAMPPPSGARSAHGAAPQKVSPPQKKKIEVEEELD